MRVMCICFCIVPVDEVEAREYKDKCNNVAWNNADTVSTKESSKYAVDTKPQCLFPSNILPKDDGARE